MSKITNSLKLTILFLSKKLINFSLGTCDL